MSIFELADEKLYDQICKNPDALIIRSKVPITDPKAEQRQKQFKYIYADDPRFMLGQGSFGKVFVCFYFEEKSKTDVRLVKLALKIISIPKSEQYIKTIEHIVSTSRQEIKALLTLRQNKHIIRIEDIVQQDNTIYIMLEYCCDRDLVYYFTELKRKGIICKETHVCYFFSQILDAFKELNKHNFMHRDIKPSNILVKNGVLKVADFGLARQIVEGENQAFEEHVGTMITAAPQIVNKLEYSSKCDIYSLGVILYWMIYEKYPFDTPPDEQDFILKKVSFPKSNEYFDVSTPMITLLKSMLTYYQSARIDWASLFEHPLFASPTPPDNSIFDQQLMRKNRQTYGRNILTQFSDDESFLDTKIPASYYKFLREIEGQQRFNRCLIEQRNSLLQNPSIYAHKMIKDEYKNLDVRFKFFRSLLHELEGLDIQRNFKSSTNQQAVFMKNMIIYSVQKYLIYLMTKVKDELVFTIPPTIFEIHNLKMAENEPLHRSFVESIVEKVKGLELTAKLSAQEVGKLTRKCEEYKINELTVLFDELNQFNLQNALVVLDQCIIQLIYFLKPEIMRASAARHRDEIVFRNLILVTHYLFMFSMQQEVFPKRYDKHFPYATFPNEEQFKSAKKFKYLTETVIMILGKFQ